MNDKELLIAVARAAGYIAATSDSGVFVIFEALGPRDWNPLTDDGDALRLAVKLDLSVCPGQVDTGVTWWAGLELCKQHGLSETHAGDPYAATRRAIVRAAAAMDSGHNAKVTGAAPTNGERSDDL